MAATKGSGHEKFRSDIESLRNKLSSCYANSTADFLNIKTVDVDLPALTKEATDLIDQMLADLKELPFPDMPEPKKKEKWGLVEGEIEINDQGFPRWNPVCNDLPQ